jgi:alkanesulfonate monooxygenase SsuD/methylene tetrahydromethanopterin reductase-like flavin-dependent oxidoreductase (luciferase family)
MLPGLYVDLRRPQNSRRSWEEHWAWWLDLLAEADRRGAPAIWIAEHHGFADGYVPQPLTLAAAVAARTTRARIGTAVLNVGLRHPRDVAEQALVADVISGGRLELGLGSGYSPGEYALFDADFAARHRTTRERVAAVQALLADDQLRPRCQRPLPVWGGFRGPRGARFAGRLGLGLLDGDRSALPPYIEGLEEGGHGAGAARMAHPSHYLLADDPERAWPEIAPHYAAMWNTYLAAGVPAGVEPRRLDAAEWLGSGARGADIDGLPRPIRFRVLTPAEAAAKIAEEFAGLPVEQVLLWASIAGMPDELTERNAELIATDLAPRLRDLPGS